MWQNSRLAVLWDASYILENATRIAHGDIPYRDFPFPYPPLTFLVQAAIIKLTGRVFFHHVLYAAAVGGLGTVVTWRIVFHLLEDAVASPRLAAFLLCVPLVPLGIYSVFPHPFYDPDCTFAILLSVWLLLRLERKRFSPIPAFFTGMALVLPALTKQNVGLAFLATALLAFAVVAAVEVRRGRPARGYLWLLGGAMSGAAIAALLIQLTAGLANYKHWTIDYARSRRMPALAEMMTVYQGGLTRWWFLAYALAALALWLGREKKALRWAGAALLALPFAWSVIYLFVDADASERAERLLVVWPAVLVAAFVCALLFARRRSGVVLVLPFLLLATIHGAFLSQQLWGSTYAIWPLLIILLAGMLPSVPLERSLLPFAAVVSITLLVSGGFYVASQERLDYAELSDGELAHSTLPALRGLATRGTWLPDFDELVRYADANIPQGDGILMLPGEDLFYFSTGRRPQFPVLMFDHTVNPYSPEEIVALSRARNIRWLILKRSLQLEEDPMESKERTVRLLLEDFEPFESLNNYEVYRHK